MSTIQALHALSAFYSNSLASMHHLCGVQAVLELRKNQPFLSQNSGDIKAVAPEELLPFLVGELRRFTHAQFVPHCCHLLSLLK
jgi:hypothetical protein